MTRAPRHCRLPMRRAGLLWECQRCRAWKFADDTTEHKEDADTQTSQLSRQSQHTQQEHDTHDNVH